MMKKANDHLFQELQIMLYQVNKYHITIGKYNTRVQDTCIGKS